MSNSAKISQPPPVTDYSATLRNIRRLIYLYLFLLIIEGALRKWIAPQFSNPLLLVRDPVVLAIYFLAWHARVFPRNGFILSLAIICILSWIVSIFVLDPYVPMSRILLVTAYGFRSNFLHLPLIFILASVFDADDVRKIGWWILVGMIPISLLMALQFHSAPDSFINRTVGLGDGDHHPRWHCPRGADNLVEPVYRVRGGGGSEHRRRFNPADAGRVFRGACVVRSGAGRRFRFVSRHLRWRRLSLGPVHFLTFGK